MWSYVMLFLLSAEIVDANIRNSTNEKFSFAVNFSERQIGTIIGVVLLIYLIGCVLILLSSSTTGSTGFHTKNIQFAINKNGFKDEFSPQTARRRRLTTKSKAS
ncbi:uncharacterized protein LOC130622943 [Hydractinia symbiolongicarpus]|uniref:uncharacterized protein LOC130622943 n=1 Tax=Hydractinia symbiolongicarpus TaxID=13093 RepID=UPI00254DF29E|nr:uncharacterized protein LOC130622943 [Hydractinia symbiolongicarpus]